MIERMCEPKDRPNDGRRVGEKGNDACPAHFVCKYSRATKTAHINIRSIIIVHRLSLVSSSVGSRQKDRKKS